MSILIPLAQARRIWLSAQRLDVPDPFGAGPEAVARAVAHLGYVQIDTINVIERSHHHILFTRMPGYRRADLGAAQSTDRSVFEYWTHALSYVPSADIAYFLAAMRRHRENPSRWFASVDPGDLARLVRRIRRDGPISIRDVGDDALVEKDHPWASRKPSKRALELGFYSGILTVSAREGMVKSYELAERHFGWPPRPRPASERRIGEYLLARALRAQGVVSLDSVCYLDAGSKPAVRALIGRESRARRLVEVRLEGREDVPHWAPPEALERGFEPLADTVHILSPFDPLVIQRKRLAAFFGYEHLFEAYLPADRRVFGYFALPVLIGERIVAAIDLKADRQNRRLLVRKRTELAEITPAQRVALDEALGRFEAFQLSAC